MAASKRLPSLLVFLGPLLCGLASPGLAAAGFTTYTNAAGFDAAAMGLTTIDFEGLASSGSFSYYGNPGSLTLSGVGFQNNGAIFVQNNNVYGTGAYLTAQQAPQNADVLTVILPAGITAVGMQIFSSDPILINLGGG